MNTSFFNPALAVVVNTPTAPVTLPEIMSIGQACEEVKNASNKLAETCAYAHRVPTSLAKDALEQRYHNLIQALITLCRTLQGMEKQGFSLVLPSEACVFYTQNLWEGMCERFSTEFLPDVTLTFEVDNR